MNKLFTKITSLALGAAMMIGVGVSVGSKSKISEARAETANGFISDASGKGSTSGAKITASSNGITFTFSKGYGPGDQIRSYANGKITLSWDSSVSTVSAVNMTVGDKNFGGTWTGATQSNGIVTWDSISNGSEISHTKQARIISLSVTYTGGSGPTPTTYTITFNSNEPAGTATNMPANTTSAATDNFVPSSTPELTGYTFVGWNTNQSATTGLSPIAISGNTILYAIWQENTPASTYDLVLDGTYLGLPNTTGGITSEDTATKDGVTYVFAPSSGNKMRSFALSNNTNNFSDGDVILMGKTGAYIYNSTAFSREIESFDVYLNGNTNASVKGIVNVAFGSTSCASETFVDGSGTALNELDSVFSINVPANSTFFKFGVTNNYNIQIQIGINFVSAPTGTLDSISLSGSYQTEFEQNSEFNHTGMIVTANYLNPEGHATVTNDASWSTPNMATLGDQTVTVTYETESADYTITIVAPKVNPTWTINDQNPLALNVGVAHQLDFTAQSGLTPSFSSSDATVATIDANGEISPLKAGSTTITMSTEGNATYKAASASITVNVTYAEPAHVTNMTIAQIAAIGEATLQQRAYVYEVTGYVTADHANIYTYGNFYVADSKGDTTNQVYVYGATENAGQLSFNSSTGAYVFASSETNASSLEGKMVVGSKITANFIAYYHNHVFQLQGVITSVVNEVTGVELDSSSAILSASSLDSSHTVQLAATVSPSNATNKGVAWTSSDPSVATVSQTGLITGVAAGSTTVTVTTDDGGKTATCSVTVKSRIKDVVGVSLNKDSTSIVIGGTEQLIATIDPIDADNQHITWSTSNSSIATVDSEGVVSAKALGTATITVTTQDGGKTDTCTVTVAPKQTTGISLDISEKTIQVGKTVTLTATVTPADATDKTVTWSSNATSVATVSDGVVTGVAAGSATITAQASGGQKATCSITVRPVETFIVDEEEFEAFVKVTDDSDLKDGEYLVVCEGQSVAFDSTLNDYDVSQNTIAVTPDDGIIESTAALKGYTFTFKASDGSFKGKGNKYFGHGSNANGITSSDSALTNTVSIDSNGNADIVCAGGAYLRYNKSSGQEKFRYFKSSTYTAQQAVQLYKLSTAGGPTPYTIGDDLYDAIFGLMTWNESEGKFLLEQCDYEYGTTFNVSTWNAMASTFSTLKTTYKLNRGVAEDGGNIVEQFLSVYDYVIGTKKPLGGAWATADDFLDRYKEGGINYGKDSLVKSPLLSSIGDTPTTVIIIISVIGVSALGGFFFLRKRKEI